MNTATRRFRITKKVPESSIITSFYLAPVDNQPLWTAAPGQYLTLRIPSSDNTVLKTYSISTDVGSEHETRITVKREAAPPHLPQVPDGVGSCWLHDHAQVGTEIDIAAPRGKFVLDESSNRPVVLLSGGVGQTPLLSMLHKLAHTKRQVWYLHGCENGNVHAMADEVNDLIDSSNGRMQQHICYRDPTDADRAARKFHSQGLIDKNLLQSLLPIDKYDWYLCGPTAFMVAQYRQLMDLGVAEECIAYEFFGKAQSLPALVAEQTTNEKLAKTPLGNTRAGVNAPSALAGLQHLTDPDAWAADEQQDFTPGLDNGIAAPEVLFARSAVTAQWSDATESLLELAEQQGLNPAFSCRACLLYTSPSPRDGLLSRMPSSA